MSEVRKFSWMSAVVAFFVALPAMGAAERRVLPGHVPQVTSRLQSLGRVDSARKMRLAIGLKLRNETALDAFLKEVYDPASTNYHHYLTPAQFTERFGPSQDDYNNLIAFVNSNGLTVSQQHSNRVILNVEGAAADVEKAFQIHLCNYQHPTEARTFYAPDAEPSVPAELPVIHIGGLNNYARPHPRWVHKDVDPKSTARVGTAPGGQLWGNDFRNAYIPGISLNGTGQSVGLVEFEGFYPSDIQSYEASIGVGNVNIVEVPVDGGVTPPDWENFANGSDNGEECSLDIEITIAMAPGLSNVYVFEDLGQGDNSDFDKVFESMVEYPNIHQFSCSWGGTTDIDTNAEGLFKEMAAQGQSFFDASGDYGAFVGPIEFPSDSPSITQVGGTTLRTGSAPDYSWLSEVVWDWESGANVAETNAASSSGGVSTYYSIPPYQLGINMTASKGSSTMRNVPDVAANSDNCYLYTDDGQAAGGWGGTSCAAPLWAAFTAILNEAATNGPVGFLNPALYRLASSDDYTSLYHDITAGRNTWNGSPHKYYAVAGYDLCTGLGSMNGPNLMRALLGNTNTSSFDATARGSVKIAITPASAVASGGAWQLDGGRFELSGATLANITAGQHTLSYRSLNGWNSPATTTITVYPDTALSASAAYTPAAALQVILEPASIAHAAGWQVDGGGVQTNDAIVNGLTAGTHTISFTSVSGWTAPSNKIVTLRNLTVSRVAADYTLLGAGVYNGLFTNTFPGAQSSGMLKNLIVAKTGVYSGRLLLANGSYPVAGVFGPSALATNIIVRSAAAGGPLTLTMALQTSNSPPSITGDVSSDEWNANLTAELQTATTGNSEYTAIVSNSAGPTSGYILMADHAGSFTLAGELADGTPFSEQTLLSGGDNLPIFLSLRGGGEILIGWLTLTDNAPSGTLTWIKQSPAGLTNAVAVQGSLWTAPPARTAAINLASGQLMFSGGSLASNLVFNVSVNQNNAFVKLADSPTNSLSGSINPHTGLFKISFGNGIGRSVSAAIGAILQNSTNAAGFFLVHTNSGSVSLQP